MSYSASKSRSQGRDAWAIIFRHPVRKDATGRSGLRVRRGLGTANEVEAQKLVDQMNELLSNQSLWDLGAKGAAAANYDARIISAFYDSMEPKSVDYWGLREDAIPVPGAEDGYARVMLLGTTGAGKTTLLRQMIGSDPKKDRFPSTSTAKTTVSDTEVICSAGSYEGVVTFFQESEVRMHLEDCAVAAILARRAGQSDEVVLQRLLEHSEQRFRFSYTLGNQLGHPEGDLLDDLEDDDLAAEEPVEEEEMVSPEERHEFSAKLRHFLVRVSQIANASGTEVESSLGVEGKRLAPEDQDAFDELLDEHLRQNKDLNKDFQAFVDEVLDEIQKRFDEIGSNLVVGGDGWPVSWTFTSDDRNLFIKTIRRFSSNYAPHFGKLLTPLVQGIRVKGPFLPAWSTEIPRLVLLDGQGLGHTPGSVGSLPTAITKRFDYCDAILLVDNAAQPMQASALSVFRSIVASGYTRKLRVGFTHLDSVTGDNLPSTQSKILHVRASLSHAIGYVAEYVGQSLARNLERELTNKCFFLANIQDTLPARAQWTRAEFQRMLSDLENSVELPPVLQVAPEYDEANLIITFQGAINAYHSPWNAKLGLGSLAGVKKEHWTRIKALSRRLATQYDEYDNLKPVADLVALLSEKVSDFLSQPVKWHPSYAAEEEKQAAVAQISQEVSRAFHELASNRVWRLQSSAWIESYELSGTGSGTRRNRAIQAILQQGAPVLGEVPTSGSPEFLAALRQLVRTAIANGGGRFAGGHI